MVKTFQISVYYTKQHISNVHRGKKSFKCHTCNSNFPWKIVSKFTLKQFIWGKTIHLQMQEDCNIINLRFMMEEDHLNALLVNQVSLKNQSYYITQYLSMKEESCFSVQWVLFEFNRPGGTFLELPGLYTANVLSVDNADVCLRSKFKNKSWLLLH